MKFNHMIVGSALLALLTAILLVASRMSPTFQALLGAENALLWQVFLPAILATSLGVFSLTIYRLNRRLQSKIDQLRQSDLQLQKLSSAVTNSGSMVIMTDAAGTIEYVNHKFTQVTGYSEQDVHSQSLELLNPEPDGFRDEQSWNSTLVQNGWAGEVLSSRKDGSDFWSAVTVSAVEDEQRQITHYIVSAIDITELKEATRKMEQLALFDSLTGLANRRLFIDRLNQAAADSVRNGHMLALLFLDLDQFKRINDTLGHDAGDQLLLIVADRLRSCVRATDTVARLGGDEFTVLLTDLKDAQAASQIAQLILKALKQPIKLDKHEVIVSTSIGITLAPTDSTSSETLMKNADLALYRAKESGRDRYHFFTEELNVQALRHLLLEQEIRQALRNNEFSLCFQPQVDLRTQSIIGVEALVRWNHPRRGLVSPDDFIPVAEETGLIVPLGLWVLKTACMQMKMIHELAGVKIKVAVNLSTRQFKDPHLEETISEVLQESGLHPHWLELEVTESMLMDDVEKVIDQLSRIKMTGVTITIDDFGSGYSSLSYLKRLPVDILKVDREFVRDIPDDLNDMEITSAVIAVAHKLNLKVVAEGVEDIDQRDFLVINKCDYAQGYLYSKPLTFEELYALLQSEKVRDIA